jgi:UDP-N-acetylglucosamine 4,6-dehydratase
MSQEFDEKEYPAVRYFLGDVRDESRLRRALEGIDIVVRAAALKQVADQPFLDVGDALRPAAI